MHFQNNSSKVLPEILSPPQVNEQILNENENESNKIDDDNLNQLPAPDPILSYNQKRRSTKSLTIDYERNSRSEIDLEARIDALLQAKASQSSKSFRHSTKEKILSSLKVRNQSRQSVTSRSSNSDLCGFFSSIFMPFRRRSLRERR